MTTTTQPTLIDLYMRHIGKSEVPDEFHYWSCLSLIGACVRDRVYYNKFANARLTPNLYVVLVGPSGLGKGIAIDTACRFAEIKKTMTHEQVGMFRGEVTGAALISHLSDQMKTRQAANCWLVTPELSMSVGVGVQADSFVKHLTELFTGGGSEWRKRTQAYGSAVVDKPCINWLAGSTVEWLVESVTSEAVQSGFLARTIVVRGEYDFEKRYRQPIYPPDYQELVGKLAARFEELSNPAFEGAMKMTMEAAEIDDKWYCERPVPEREEMLPTWKRQHDIVLKVAMLLSLARSNDLKIQAADIANAQTLVTRRQAIVPYLMQTAMESASKAAVQRQSGVFAISRVSAFIKKYGRVLRRRLVTLASARGIKVADVEEAITLLEARGDVSVEHVPASSQRGRPTKAYVWTGDYQLPDEEDLENEIEAAKTQTEAARQAERAVIGDVAEAVPERADNV